jgi:phenylpropionate dioxygenase-like ring-hydroxylating dioxygenase large terminal subunit
MESRVAGSEGRKDWHIWPRYEAAVFGFRNYWYPVLWSREVGRKPHTITLLDEEVMFVRDRDGKPYALRDRCPHRGVPLSLGQQEFPGTWTCGYHGWTYDLQNGVMIACLTDGPDSPLCGKVRVPSYPVEEHHGVVWVFMGDEAPPATVDIPDEMQVEHLAVGGRIDVRPGNWRYAAENGFDEGHAKYLHRTAIFLTFRELPAYSRTRVVPTEDGKWITRELTSIGFEAEYPRVGKWPRSKEWYKRRGIAPRQISIRMPGTLRVPHPGYYHFEWYVPVDADHHRYVQLAVKAAHGWSALAFQLRYWTYRRWLLHGHFTGQDGKMVQNMRIPPERLYRPDVSVIAWRNLCEQPRGATTSDVRMEEQDIAPLDRDAVTAPAARGPV